MRGVIAQAMLAAGLLIAPAASAQLFDPLTAQQIASALERDGLKTTVTPIKDGDGPFVEAKIDGAGFRIAFDACDDDGTDCEILQFSSGFSFDDGNDHLTAAKMNEWNSGNWGKAWLDEDGDPWLGIEINIVGGITKTNLDDTIDWWKDLIGDFIEFIDWQPN